MSDFNWNVNSTGTQTPLLLHAVSIAKLYSVEGVLIVLYFG
jgi:hypothetical protein